MQSVFEISNYFNCFSFCNNYFYKLRLGQRIIQVIHSYILGLRKEITMFQSIVMTILYQNKG